MSNDVLSRATDELDLAIAAKDPSALIQVASTLHYADLAGHYADLEDEDRDFFLKTIGPKMATDLIGELPGSLVEEALNHFRPSELRVIFKNLSDDDRVDILQGVGTEARQRYFALLGPDDQKITRSLLRYEEDTAGGRMTTHIGRITADMTVRDATNALRADEENTETLARIFVIDNEGRLLGKIRLRDLAFYPRSTPVRDIMKPVEHTVLATADQEEAARQLAKYDMVVLPVVDEFDHLLGVLTYDDALEIFEEESTEDLEKLAGIAFEQSEATYLNTSIINHFRRRSVWLVGLAFLSIGSGYVMYRFEDVLGSAFMLALFLPMVVAAGGNSGGQAATMVIRAMSLGEVKVGDVARIAWRELQVGALLGLLLGASMGLFILFVLPLINGDPGDGVTFPRLAAAVSLALAAQVTSSTMLGCVLPLAARAAKLDPAVVSSPSLSSTVDVTGMILYFSVARMILGI